MTSVDHDPLRDRVAAGVGKPMSADAPSVSPDEVNIPMIRHWVDAFADHNPVYLDQELAAKTRFKTIVAPPAMMQTWTMGRPVIAGIAERGGAAAEIPADSPIGILIAAGYTGTLATNSEFEFDRYLRIGDRLHFSTELESVSEQKITAVGKGYFVTWINTYYDANKKSVGRQRFRIYKFDPQSIEPTASPAKKKTRKEPAKATGEELPPFVLEVTPTVVVAGAIASRDFMPVHHDRNYAIEQGAPNIFMNILTTNGYVSRYITDWAGPEAMVRSIAIRLGAPAVPGHQLSFSGQVISERASVGERVVEVSVRAANDLGDHATGMVALSLP